MINGKTVLAVIPARGGSKRLHRKNVLSLAGKSLIIWTIEAAIKSKYIDKIIVSSEDKEILKISLEAGAEIIKRPQELATDEASTFSVVNDVISRMESQFDYVTLLQPTSPLRNNEHVDESFDLLVGKNADAVISVCETVHSPLWANTLPEDGSMENFLNDGIINKRSQDIEKYYRLNGAIYISRIEKFLNESTFFLKKNIYSYEMDINASIDVDTIIDFELCKILMALSRTD